MPSACVCEEFSVKRLDRVLSSNDNCPRSGWCARESRFRCLDSQLIDKAMDSLCKRKGSVRVSGSEPNPLCADVQQPPTHLEERRAPCFLSKPSGLLANELIGGFFPRHREVSLEWEAGSRTARCLQLPRARRAAHTSFLTAAIEA
ncbi:hypothetical protein cyc_00485 [Cyclospora cayetanensis]|uniref:Uncharacterized protein n=1 Tax=Cyclospora cayetanensis TaxID=88456 RepID=A0A1D3D5B0_9EIME|nr:hypothetical protein cyc_00485 [Cyclospora cayetanensis]